MAKSRQQLINTSSFLSDQREKIGGLNVKRSTITADSFKKGTSQESVDNIENRVGANEKKITLLKNIIKAQKSDLGENLRSLEPEQESKSDQQQMGSPLLESLQSIASTVDSIRNTLIRQQDADKDAAEKMRIAGEKADRDKQEKGLENTEPKPLAKLGDKIVAPVMSIFGKIFNFIKTLILGKFLMNFLDWFSNPANQGKIASFVRFIKDWWPALTAAVLLFGTGFTSLAVGLVKLVAGFTVKLVALVPKLLAALAKLKLGKLLKMIPGAGILKGGLILGGGVLATYGIGKMLNKDKEAENLAAAQNQSTEKLISEGMDSGEAATTSQSVVTGDSNRMTDTNLRSNNNMLQTGMNDPLGGGFSRFNKGGQVPGSGNTDTVPAMLTPGEFVMSKGAVQQYGVDTLAGMNAAAGGDNKPKYKDGKVYANTGGLVTPYNYLVEQGLQVTDIEDGMKRLVHVYNPDVVDKKTGQPQGTKFLGTYKGKDQVSTQQFINSMFSIDQLKIIKHGKEKPFGFKRMVGGAADFMTGGMFDFDKKNPEGSPKGFGPARMMGGLADFATMGLTDFDKRGAGNFQFNPIGGGDNKKYEVKSRTPKNTVVAYQQEVNKNQKQKTAPGSGGNEIPSFDVAPIRDPLKMVTLQIVLF